MHFIRTLSPKNGVNVLLGEPKKAIRSMVVPIFVA